MNPGLDEITTLLARAQTLESLGRHREAIAELHRALQVDPTSDRALCSLAYNHYRLGEREIARSFAERAITANPDNEWAYRLRSILARRRGDGGAGVADAKEAVRLAPGERRAWYTLCEAQRSEGRLADAAHSAGELLRIAPNWPLTYLALAAVATRQKHLEDAEAHAREALRLDPHCAAALNQLGTILVARADTAGAVDAFYRAVQLNPQDDSARDNFYRFTLYYCSGMVEILVHLAIAVGLAVIIGGMAFLVRRTVDPVAIAGFVTLVSLAGMGDSLRAIGRRFAGLPEPVRNAFRGEKRRRHAEWRRRLLPGWTRRQ